MQGTGIIRRIDDLGRVVIPKEIRRVHKLREGDPLEIFCTKEGILFKKYSPIGVISDFASNYADSLHEATNHIVLITDRDDVIAVSGGSKKTYLEREIGSLVFRLQEERKSVLCNNESEAELIKNFIEKYSSYVFAPIFQMGDILGSVIFVSHESKMSESDVRLVEVAASFLSKQTE